jgi:hypothetical protein
MVIKMIVTSSRSTTLSQFRRSKIKISLSKRLVRISTEVNLARADAIPAESGRIPLVV